MSEPDTDDGVLRSDGGCPVRVLTLDRPASRNALDGPLHAAMLSAVRTVAAEPEVRAVVLTGAGDAFSAGGDFGLIQQMQDDADLRRATLNRSRTLFWSLVALEVPVIAAVNGPAVGAGATLALLCDIVLMAEGAYLAEPRLSIGLVPGDGSAILWPLLAGVPAARAYLLTGDRMPAAEAHRLGLVHRVVESDALLAEAKTLADRLAKLSPHSVRATKRALSFQVESAALAGFEFALDAESQSFDTPELRAAVQQHADALRAVGMTDASARVAVVTGGTRGIGAAISTRLSAAGTTVVAAYHEDDAAAGRFVAQHRSAGAVTTHRVDVGDPDSCRELISAVFAAHGRLDYLVNNAGALGEHKLADLSSADWDDTLRVNLTGAFHLSQAAIVHMRQARFGRIVNIGSVTAVMGSPFQIDYAAAKAGLVGLTRSLARSVARAGITVNCVIPGGFSTDLLSQLTLTDTEALERSVPVGRYGRPEELAHVVASLVHDDASYVTGTVIAVDGGLGMGL